MAQPVGFDPEHRVEFAPEVFISDLADQHHQLLVADHIIAVAVLVLFGICWPDPSNAHEIADVPPLLLKQIEHFFEHYKDLEPGKWVKIDGWEDAAAAKAEIVSSVERFEAE